VDGVGQDAERGIWAATEDEDAGQVGQPARRHREELAQVDDGQHLHGGAEACHRHCRAWALLYNFRPWNPATVRVNDGWRSPAERLNEHRYHDDWLQNLLISASLGGFRR